MSQDGQNTRRDRFGVPVWVKKVFAAFPLRAYEANELPTRSPRHRDEHTLYIWSSDGEEQHASFNPTCLKWQTYLKFHGIRFRTRASNNHASPTGVLPFLLPAQQQSSPVPSNKLEKWASDRSKADGADANPRQDFYTSLLDHAVRRAWLYTLYLCPENFDSVARRLYVLPSSGNPLVGLAISHQLRNAAAQELLKTTPQQPSPEDIIQEAVDALGALSTLLGADNDWFFGRLKPDLFDASVFAYTHLLLDEGMGWRLNPLAEKLSAFRNLVDHRNRILRLYFRQ